MCYSFVEIQIQNQWITCDLGGYSAKFIIDESLNPEQRVSIDARYKELLATWDKPKPPITSALEYCQHLTSSAEVAKKRLVELGSSAAVHNLHLNMQDYCVKTARPCFYIRSPDDLVCASPYLKRGEQNKGY